MQPNVEPRWKTIWTYELGVMPLPVYAAAGLIVLLSAHQQRLTADLIGGLAVMMVAGVLLDFLGHKIPLLRSIGGPAILCLFVPAALVGYQQLDSNTLGAIKAAMTTDNLLYLYIASLVVGSIFGIDRHVLSSGFLRMCAPFLVGTVAAVSVGMLTGKLMGYGAHHTFFYIIIPILSGGIGEGILPLSIAYAGILGTAQGDLVATMIPAAMIGNVVAILSAGTLAWFGDRNPRFSGNGNLVKAGADMKLAPTLEDDAPDLRLMGAGLLIICTMFTFGSLLAPFTGIPGPVMMIISVAILKLAQVLPSRMERGAYQMYRFVAVNLTPAVLVGLGAIFISWDQLVSALTPGYFAVCAATVITLIATGFGVGLLVRLHPVEAAIVNACHSGLGGTGDVAILSASDRMGLMPFSQIVTRVGGAAMVVLATVLMRHFA